MVFEKIREIIVDQLGVDENEVKMETAFEDLGVDSLDLFQIIIAVEEEFEVQIENAESIKTVGNAVTFVEERVGEEA